MLPLTTILEQQWFSPQEARVYLTVLELGQSPVSQIARKLSENRVTVYSILQWLVKKSIIFELVKNKVTHYIALSPQKLLTLSQEKLRVFEDAMGSFLAMSSLGDTRPSIQVYEGIDGIKLCYEDTLNYPKSSLRAFLWYADVEPNLKRWLNNWYLDKRIKKEILAKVLIPWALKNNYGYFAQTDPKRYANHTQLKFIQDQNFSIHNEINIYGGDRVMMVMFWEKELMSTIIKSKYLHDTLGAIFDLLWQPQSDE